MTLADIVLHRVPLAAREAAALTLAVAREWDRQRALRGPLPLPDTAAIALESDGRISFVIPSREASDAPSDAAGDIAIDAVSDDASSLSALFGQLLGIEEAGPVVSRGADATLMSTTGAAGSLDGPSATGAAFRAALQRFADQTAGVLPAVFQRAAAALQLPVPERRVSATPVRRVPDRRRLPDTVTELRRELRGFERQAFEARRPAAANAPLLPLAVLPARVAASWIAAACTLAVLAGIAITTITDRRAGSASRLDASERRASEASEATTPAMIRATAAATTANRAAAPTAPAPDLALASSGAVALAVKPAPLRAVTPASPALVRVRSGRKPGPKTAAARPAHAATVFAGGARSIGWNANAR